MNFLADADAIIFDMRENAGGPRRVQPTWWYVLDEPAHPNLLGHRNENRTTQFWTLPYVPSKRRAGKPAYALTLKGTFSGAEEFTYNLKRAEAGGDRRPDYRRRASRGGGIASTIVARSGRRSRG